MMWRTLRRWAVSRQFPPDGNFRDGKRESISKAAQEGKRAREMVTMNSKYLRICIAASSLGLVGVSWPTGARAQAPAGPVPAAQPQPPSAREGRPQGRGGTGKPRTAVLGTRE